MDPDYRFNRKLPDYIINFDPDARRRAKPVPKSPPSCLTSVKPTDKECYAALALQNGIIDETGKVLFSCRDPMELDADDRARVLNCWRTPLKGLSFSGNILTFLSYLVPYFCSKTFEGSAICQTQGTVCALGKDFWKKQIDKKIPPSNSASITPEMWNFCQPSRCSEFWITLPPSYDHSFHHPSTIEHAAKLNQLRRFQHLIVYFWALQALPDSPYKYFSALREFAALTSQEPQADEKTVARLTHLKKVIQDMYTSQALLFSEGLNERTNKPIVAVEIRCSLETSIKVNFAFSAVDSVSYLLDNFRLQISPDEENIVCPTLAYAPSDAAWQAFHDQLIHKLDLTTPALTLTEGQLALGRYLAHVTCSGAVYLTQNLEKLLCQTMTEQSTPAAFYGGIKYLEQGPDAIIAYIWNTSHFFKRHEKDLQLNLANELSSVQPSSPFGALLKSEEFISGELHSIFQLVAVLHGGLPVSLPDAPHCRQVTDQNHLEISWNSDGSFHNLLIPLNFTEALKQFAAALNQNKESSLAHFARVLEVFVPALSATLPRRKPGSSVDPLYMKIYEGLKNHEAYQEGALRLLYLLEGNGVELINANDLLALPELLVKKISSSKGKVKVKLTALLDAQAALYQNTPFNPLFAAMREGVLKLENISDTSCRLAALRPLLVCGDDQILSQAWVQYGQLSPQLKVRQRVEFLNEIVFSLEPSALLFALIRVADFCKHPLQPAEQIKLMGTYLDRLIRQSLLHSCLQRASSSQSPPLCDSLRSVVEKDHVLRFNLIPFPHAAKEIYASENHLSQLLDSLIRMMPLVKSDPGKWWGYCVKVFELVQIEGEHSVHADQFAKTFIKALAIAPSALSRSERFTEFYQFVAHRLFNHRKENSLVSLLNFIVKTEFDQSVHAWFKQIISRHLDKGTTFSIWQETFNSFRKTEGYKQPELEIDRPFLVRILSFIVSSEKCEEQSSDVFNTVQSLISKINPVQEEIPRLRDYFLLYFESLVKLRAADNLLNHLKVCLTYFIESGDTRIARVMHDTVALILNSSIQKSLWIKFDPLLERLKNIEPYREEPLFFLESLLTGSFLRDQPIRLSCPEVLRADSTQLQMDSSLLDCLEQTLYLVKSEPQIWWNTCTQIEQMLQSQATLAVHVDWFHAILLQALMISSAALSEQEGFSDLVQRLAERLFQERKESALHALLKQISSTRFSSTVQIWIRDLLKRHLEENAPFEKWTETFAALQGKERHVQPNDVLDRPLLLGLLTSLADSRNGETRSVDEIAAVHCLTRSLLPLPEEISSLTEYFITSYGILLKGNVAGPLLDYLEERLDSFIAINEERILPVIRGVAALMMAEPYALNLWRKFVPILMRIADHDPFLEHGLQMLEILSDEQFIKPLSSKAPPLQCFRQPISSFEKRLEPAQKCRLAKVYARVVSINPEICRVFESNWLEQELQAAKAWAECAGVFMANSKSRKWNLKDSASVNDLVQNALASVVPHLSELPSALVDEFTALLTKIPPLHLAKPEWKPVLIELIIRSPVRAILFQPLVVQAIGREQEFFKSCHRLQAKGSTDEVKGQLVEYNRTGSPPEAKEEPLPVVPTKPPLPPQETAEEIRAKIVKIFSTKKINVANLNQALALLEKLSPFEWDLWLQFITLSTAASNGWYLKKVLIGIFETDSIFFTFVRQYALALMQQFDDDNCVTLIRVCIERGIAYCLKNSGDNHTAVLSSIREFTCSNVIQKKIKEPKALITAETQCVLHRLYAHQTDPSMHDLGDRFFIETLKHMLGKESNGIENVSKKPGMNLITSEENLLLFRLYCMDPYIPQSLASQGVFLEWFEKTWEKQKLKLKWNDAVKVIGILCSFNIDSINPERTHLYLRYLFEYWDDLHEVDWEGEKQVLSEKQAQTLKKRNVRSILTFDPSVIRKSAPFAEITVRLMTIFTSHPRYHQGMMRLLDDMRTRFDSHSEPMRASLVLHYCTNLFSFIGSVKPEKCTGIKRALSDFINCLPFLQQLQENNQEPYENCKNAVKAFIGALPFLLNQNDLEVTQLVKKNIDNLKTISWIREASDVNGFSWIQLLVELSNVVSDSRPDRTREVVEFVRTVYMDCTHPQRVEIIKEIDKKEEFTKTCTIALGFFFMSLRATDCVAHIEWDELIHGLSMINVRKVLTELIKDDKKQTEANYLWKSLAAFRLIRHIKTQEKSNLNFLQGICFCAGSARLNEIASKHEVDDYFRYILHWIIAANRVIDLCSENKVDVLPELITRRTDFIIQLTKLILTSIKDPETYKKYFLLLSPLLSNKDSAFLVYCNFTIYSELSGEVKIHLEKFKEFLKIKIEKIDQHDIHRSFLALAKLVTQKAIKFDEVGYQDRIIALEVLEELQESCVAWTSPLLQSCMTHQDVHHRLRYLTNWIKAFSDLIDICDLNNLEIDQKLHDRKFEFVQELIMLIFPQIKTVENYVMFLPYFVELMEDLLTAEIIAENFQINETLPEEVKRLLTELKAMIQAKITELAKDYVEK